MNPFRRLTRAAARAFSREPRLVFSRSKKAAKAHVDGEHDTNQKLARELAIKGKYVPKHFRQAVKHG